VTQTADDGFIKLAQHLQCVAKVTARLRLPHPVSQGPADKGTSITVKPVLSSHTRKAQKSGCLTEVNISTKLRFGNILFGCLRQVG